MLAGSSLIGFVPISNAERARAFYVDTLGLEFVVDDQFAVVVRCASSTIRLVRMGKVQPVTYTICGWEIADMETTVKELKARGVKFARYPFVEQDELDIWTTPNGNKVAWFEDPDGNVLSLSKH